jgi:hypothetical protein
MAQKKYSSGHLNTRRLENRAEKPDYNRFLNGSMVQLQIPKSNGIKVNGS